MVQRNLQINSRTLGVGDEPADSELRHCHSVTGTLGAERLTTALLVSKDRTLSPGGAVPPLVPELALALGDGQSCSFLDTGQQEVLPMAEFTLLWTQREASTAQLLGDAGRGHA